MTASARTGDRSSANRAERSAPRIAKASGRSRAESSGEHERNSARETDSSTPRSLAGGSNPWLVAMIVSIATFMEVLDTSIANVALKHIAGSLSAGIDESTWVLTSYLVANAIVLPISGWLANLIGRKRFYMMCVALFTASSLACGLSTSLGMLIFFRVLQGIGGGGLAPSEQSILADTFKPNQRGLAFALYGIAVVFAPAVGPTLGGWITDSYSWHWIFLINVPVGLVSLVLSYLVLKEPPVETREREKRLKRGLRIDYVGFALIALGLGCMQVVLDKGERDDWFASPFILSFTVISAVSIVALIAWELLHPHPIVDLRLFGRKTFASSCVLMFALGFILFGTTQLLPQLTQTLFGYTATLAGLVITPGGFAVILMMPFVGIMVNKFQPKYLVGIGMLIEAAAMWHMSKLSLDASYRDFAWARIYQAAGLAFLFVPITTASYAGLPGNKSNDASAMINLMRNLGGSFGISVAQTLLAQRQQHHQTHLVSHVIPTGWRYQRAIDALQGAMQHAVGSEVDAIRTARAQLFQMVQRQTQILAYLDVFRVMAWCALAALPLVFLLQNIKPGESKGGH